MSGREFSGFGSGRVLSLRVSGLSGKIPITYFRVRVLGFRVFGFFSQGIFATKRLYFLTFKHVFNLFVRKHDKNGDCSSILSKLFKYCKVASVSVNF